MKQSYKNPELELIELKKEDIITDSNVTKKFPIGSGSKDFFFSNDEDLYKFNSDR